VNVSAGETAKELEEISDIPRTQKQVYDLIVTPEKQKITASKVMSPPYKIKKGLNTNNIHRQHNGVP